VDRLVQGPTAGAETLSEHIDGDVVDEKGNHQADVLMTRARQSTRDWLIESSARPIDARPAADAQTLAFHPRHRERRPAESTQTSGPAVAPGRRP
jgi:hypothetical protein